MEIRTTNDGSHTLYDPLIQENYHSIHGALDECTHVFIKSGLEPVLRQKKGIYVLEVGFGTGLNAWLSLGSIKDNHADSMVSYVAVEPYPVSAHLIEQLNYTQTSGNGHSPMRELYAQLHAAEWGTETKILPGTFHLRKLQVTFEDFKPYWLFDLIFYDAFAPGKHPQMWDKSLFQRLYDITVPGGTLVTYCAKGQFKRDLREMGWEVESPPGPTGKREMTRATKPLDAGF